MRLTSDDLTEYAFAAALAEGVPTDQARAIAAGIGVRMARALAGARFAIAAPDSRSARDESIRRDRAAGASIRALARRYGCSKSRIHAIVSLPRG